MPDLLEIYIKEVQTALEESPIVLSSILATEIEPEISAIKIKGTAFLIENYRLEFLEYLKINKNKVRHDKYRFQLLNPENIPLIRWDNAPHHPEVQSFPYHKHNLEKNEVTLSKETNLKTVLEEIVDIIVKP
ncbi:MAG: DUF6516 family protein [Promethearchaeota archaeon]